MRLFAALYPDSAAADSIERALAGVQLLQSAAGPPPLRWVPRERWHLTLAFYGEVPDGAVPDLTRELADVTATTGHFEVVLRGAGVFDDRILWLGVGGDSHALHDLSAATVQAGEAVGLRPDRRPRYRGHVTVAKAGHTVRAAARVAQRRALRGRPADQRVLERVLAQPAAALAVYAGPAWQAEELCLVESEMAQSRPTYRIVERFTLGG